MGNCQDNQKVLEGLGNQQDQSHLMNHWRNLPTQDKRKTFEQQLTKVNVNKIRKMYKKSSRTSGSKSNQLSSSTESSRTSVIYQYRSLPDNMIIKKQQILEHKKQLDTIGLQAIKNGQVAVIIMAASQPPSINLESSIGTYDIGLDSAATIFEIFVKKLMRLQIMSNNTDQNKKIKLYVMTSTENKNQIKLYFKNKDYFGYGVNNVFFFSQPVQPIVDQQGKIVLKSQGNIYMSPRGSGGIYTQIRDKSLLTHLTNQGVKYIFFGPVNNLLLKIADPTTLGYLIQNKKDVVATCIQNTEESFAHFGLTLDCKNIKVYQDRQFHPKKKWANTGSCYMSIQFLDNLINNSEFLQRMQSNFHDVVKQVPIYNAKSNTKITTKCIFFETFYHQAFEKTNNISLIEIDPTLQFAPIKNNGQGKYSIISARDELRNWYKNLLIKNNVKLVGQGSIELNPALTYQGQNISQLVKQKVIKESIHLPQYIQ